MDTIFLTSLFSYIWSYRQLLRLYPLAGKSAGYYQEGEGVPEEKPDGRLIKAAWTEGLRVCQDAGPVLSNITKNVKNSSLD